MTIAQKGKKAMGEPSVIRSGTELATLEGFNLGGELLDAGGVSLIPRKTHGHAGSVDGLIEIVVGGQSYRKSFQIGSIGIPGNLAKSVGERHGLERIPHT